MVPSVEGGHPRYRNRKQFTLRVAEHFQLQVAVVQPEDPFVLVARASIVREQGLHAGVGIKIHPEFDAEIIGPKRPSGIEGCRGVLTRTGKGKSLAHLPVGKPSTANQGRIVAANGVRASAFRAPPIDDAIGRRIAGLGLKVDAQEQGPGQQKALPQP